MKKISKLLALVLALALCLCMAPAAFAAANGKITITNATSGKEYKAFKIFEATIDQQDNVTTGISYLATEQQKNWYEDVTNKVTIENPFVFTKNGDKYAVTVKEGVTEDTVTAFLKEHITFNADTKAYESNDLPSADGTSGLVDAGTATATAGTSTAEFTSLEYGYYFVTSAVGSTVTVTSTNPEVSVIDKNQGPGWTPDPDGGDPDGGKSIKVADGTLADSNTASIGEEFVFQIAAHGTAYDGEKKINNFVFTDTMDNGFTVKTNSLKITIGTTTVYENGAAINGTGVTVAPAAEDPNDFTVTIPWNETAYGANGDIVMTYTASLNANATVGNTGNSNTAKMNWTYKESSDIPTTPPDDKTTTYTYSFDLVKTDDKTDGEYDVLNGAEFKLSKADGTVIKLIKDDAGYRVATADEIPAEGETPNANLTDTIVAGNVKIKGLGNGTYSLTETKAPAGYNILTESQSFTIADGNNDATLDNTNTVYTSGGVRVENKAGNLLPSTGGIGTTIFYVVGGLLTLVAGVLLITKKRMNNID